MAAERTDRKVRTHLATSFAQTPDLLCYGLHLWEEHRRTGLADKPFVDGLIGGQPYAFRQRISEMAPGHHLRALGLEVFGHPEGEPDFHFMVDGQKIWVETTCPEPSTDLLKDWMTPPRLGEPRARRVPHDDILLRWTNAFDCKTRQFDKYRSKGIVKDTDCCVIAIDGSLLNQIPEINGISQKPYNVEIVFAVGPLSIPIDRETGTLGRAAHTTAAVTRKRNSEGGLSPVHRTSFLLPDHAGLSAVLGFYNNLHSRTLAPLHVAHNPLARSTLPSGIFGQDAEEWMACKQCEDDTETVWEISHLPSAIATPGSTDPAAPVGFRDNVPDPAYSK